MEQMSEFTEAELKEIEAGVSCGRAFDHTTVDRLVKALRLWNERAHQMLDDGVKLASGISDSAMLLEDAGVKLKAERDAALLQNGEMLELLRQADDLYTGYGLICGPILDFPKYEGKVNQGAWINAVRKITRATEKQKCVCGGADLGVAHEPGCPSYVEKRKEGS